MISLSKCMGGGSLFFVLAFAVCFESVTHYVLLLLVFALEALNNRLAKCRFDINLD